MSRGAKNTQTGGLKYLSFMAGKFVQRVDENTTGATPRELEKGPNSGKIVYELKFDTYEGQIYDIQTEDRGEYGVNLNIFMDVSTIEEPEAKVKISLPFSSGAAKGFLTRVPVIDFVKDVCLKGYNIKNEQSGRFNSYLVPYQDGQKLLPQFTKDNPNGLPKMQQIKVKGKLQWDDTEQLEFFEGLIKSVKFPGEPESAEVDEQPDNTVDVFENPPKGQKEAF